ncbi:MAG: T9SS type A sorting domain-containing protein [Bacteroidota bacterium]
MKSVQLLFVAFLAITVSLQAQTSTQFQISSDLTWGVGNSFNGPFDGSPFDVGLCVDEDIIDCLCGEGYASPNLANNFPTCPNMVPIWGAAPPADCDFAADTYFFQQTFDLRLSDCEDIESAVATIQADNEFTLWINGTQIANQSSWPTVYTYNVASLLVDGTNTITVEVENYSGAGCFNYAFLAFCLTVQVTEWDLGDGFFDVIPTNVPGGTLLSSTGVTLPAANHEWYFLNGPGISGPWNAVGVIQGSFNFVNYFAVDCIGHRIIHRVTAPNNPNCEVCWDHIFYNCGGEKPQLFVQEERAIVDCAILDGYRFPVIGRPAFRSDSQSAFIQNELNKNLLLLRPNPTQGRMEVDMNGFSGSRYEIIDLQGKLLSAKNIPIEEAVLELQLGDMPDGVYMLRVTDEKTGQSKVEKFTISH